MPRFNAGNTRKQGRGKSYSLRMGQMFGPYSVGAIYPCDANTTVMIAGLDAYEQQVNKGALETIADSRLKRYVGVNWLYAPPVDDGHHGGFVPALRFPNWLYCPRCGQMQYKESTNVSTQIRCEACSKKFKRDIKLIPERFVVVCPHGHIDNFPVMQWVHNGTDIDPKSREHVVSRRTMGGSTTMGDIVYQCTCGARKSLHGANRPEGLNKIGYHCSGRQPWLNRISKQQCSCDGKDLRVVIMGATNVCYPDVVSSVLIPDALDERVKKVADEQFTTMLEFDRKGDLDAALSLIASMGGVDPEDLRLAYQRKKTEGDSGQSNIEYLHDEYLTLRDPKIRKSGEFVGRAVDPNEYESPLIRNYIAGVSLIDTLTVTRALVGFTRLNPEYNDLKSMEERRRELSRKRLDWTLANQTVGEGVFVEFDQSVLEEWCARPEVAARIEVMQENLNNAIKSRNARPREINPLFVAIHTFSHIVLLGISEVCGYSAASLRERVYCQAYLEDGAEEFEDMHGVLIYTASASGDGSLGGLVRSGEPGRFEEILNNSMQKATWCSDDPVCIESRGQGLDSCNLAACYNCALVPETACENGNRFLDRALIVGTFDMPTTGLFSADLYNAL